jgi:hypothetical protein
MAISLWCLLFCVGGSVKGHTEERATRERKRQEAARKKNRHSDTTKLSLHTVVLLYYCSATVLLVLLVLLLYLAPALDELHQLASVPRALRSTPARIHIPSNVSSSGRPVHTLEDVLGRMQRRYRN